MRNSRERKLTKRLNLWIEPEVYEKLKECSEAEHRKIAENIRMLIEEWIEKKWDWVIKTKTSEIRKRLSIHHCLRTGLYHLRKSDGWNSRNKKA